MVSSVVLKHIYGPLTVTQTIWIGISVALQRSINNVIRIPAGEDGINYYCLVFLAKLEVKDLHFIFLLIQSKCIYFPNLAT